MADTPRNWPVVIRRAREEDRPQVLAFATHTWNGWDYIPNAWPVWLTAPDGAFLVGCVGESGGTDAAGESLDAGKVVAVTRIAMVSPTEAWLEGIRVDPRVRGMGIGGDLQVAELAWVAAQHAHIVRYATSGNNEASHRLGARDGITLLARYTGWDWRAPGAVEDGGDGGSAFDPVVRARAHAARQRAVVLLTSAGLALPDDEGAIADCWQRLAANLTFQNGQRLYEARAWALAELTEALFRRHVERAEVFVRGIRGDQPGNDGWAVAILVGEQLPSEDADLRLALLCGDGPAAAALAEEIQRLVGQPIRFRAPVGAPMTADHEQRFRAAGFVSNDRELHILGRHMAGDPPLPAVDPARVVLADAPERIVPPRW